MKRALLLFALLAAILLLTGCGERQDKINVVVATDLHYIAPTLYDSGPCFTQLLEAGDGKLSQWSEELCAAFIQQMLLEKPEAVLLTGDLSFNGEQDSHEALVTRFRTLEDAGITVLVIPGNHDLDSPYSASFSGENWSRVPSVTAEDFARIYGEFGFDEALSRDADSLSYLYPLNGNWRVLMLDLNTAHDPCGLSDETLRWVDQQLQQARHDGKRVLAAGHQNLMQQTVFRDGYVMDGAEELLELLRKYEVKLYLSGHLHVQHSMSRDGVTEIATSALSVWPCQYGRLQTENGKLCYETRRLNVSGWAREQGRAEPELQNFDVYAAAFFDHRSNAQLRPLLADLEQERQDAVIEAFCSLNRAYFSGDLSEPAGLDPEGVLFLLEQRSPLYAMYLRSVVPDLGKDFTHWRE